MDNIQLGIHNLPLEYINDLNILQTHIYSDMYQNYYWSSDFSAEYYMAQAKAGFIAVTDIYENQELLLPEIQYTYAVLDFEDLHISKKVKKLINSKNLTIKISQNFDEVAKHISKAHKDSWLSTKYVNTLKNTKNLNDNFQAITVELIENEKLIAGEIGYIIGGTYTSLSGFCSKEKRYNNYGTAQLVLLGQYLQKEGFDFWNLGQPYMDYKLALGAKIYKRDKFLKRWYRATYFSSS